MPREPVTRITAQDWRHLLTVGALVTGVLGTLLLGGRLQAEPSGPPPRSLAEVIPEQSPSPEPPRAETASPVAENAAPTPSPAAPTNVPTTRPKTMRPTESRTPPPAPRRTSDAASAEWTLQFMVTCESATADRMAREFGDDSRLHMLAVRIEDRDCMRVCWGDFTTPEAAVALGGVPAGLLAVNDSPIPRRISDLR